MCATKKTNVAAEVEAALLVALRTTDRKRMISRLVHGLQEFDYCHRCGGSGSYSYCQMYGTTCFGCGGAGKQAPKLTRELLARVEAKVAAGDLDAYLVEAQATAARKATAKKASDRLFAVWKAQPECAKYEKSHWSEQSDLAAATNTVCSRMHDIVGNSANRIQSLKAGDNHQILAAMSWRIEQATLIAEAAQLSVEHYAAEKGLPVRDAANHLADVYATGIVGATNINCHGGY